MSFWQKIKDGFRNFMIGRNGPDQLTQAILIASVIVMLISAFTGLYIVNLIGTAGYIYCLFRMFSRNVAKRREENAKWIEFKTNFGRENHYRWMRLKNSRQYKYFRCPQCRSWMRMERKLGTKHVVCGKCGNKFEQKS